VDLTRSSGLGVCRRPHGVKDWIVVPECSLADNTETEAEIVITRSRMLLCSYVFFCWFASLVFRT